ncbi:ABC transporter substrate-binding protein [Phytomonospora endophytica]|uniref:ABC transporter substrate-binding protein n=1 Tax=Phytomonospora endophytica TaxID=714109 RepID=UPI001A5E9649|nr:iron-siderophore ABC transporter substrate-binding protein [Phytomonospora endophytica]GIG64636.1 ABC transporter periplasmic component [Phytomonospora endophytica]
MLRTVLVAAGLALSLAACGKSDPPAGQQTGDTHPVAHAMGTTEVPLTPQRVVVLDTDKLDTAVTLGITPVGAAVADQTGLPTYLGDAVGTVQVVGTLTEPDLEAIEGLHPDLILGTKFRQEQFYDELSAIAPTVFTEKVGITWKENFLLDGEALGKKDTAADLLGAYENRAETVGEDIDGAADLEVGIVRFMPDHIRVYGPDSFSGIVVADAGLDRPDFQKLNGADDKRFAKVSQEKIDDADGDVLFYCAYGADATAALEEVTDGSLWKGMSAVENGKAYTVNDEIWMTGIGVTAANMILDDLAAKLT